ncbi:hypothetical protein GQ600_14366 [Phytophthora cactorum]|nr:hypothetical protein GQ600_14366 [Phytophthora cactorum]
MYRQRLKKPATRNSSVCQSIRRKQRTYTVTEKQVAVLLVQDVGVEEAARILGYPRSSVSSWSKQAEICWTSRAQNVQDAHWPRAEGVVSWCCGHRHVHEGCSADEKSLSVLHVTNASHTHKEIPHGCEPSAYFASIATCTCAHDVTPIS